MKTELDVLGSVGPVTALCVYESHVFTVLAGCGSVVQVYRAGTSDIETSLVALPCSTIHGFQLGPVLEDTKSLCVFGAKCLRILHLDKKTVKEKSSSCCASYSIKLNAVTAAKEVEDWIWDVAWLQSGDRWSLGLALAHNTVLHWDWKADTILHRVTCMEKCILYCAHFIGTTWSDLVLAAGTVFNQVVLWSPSSSHHGSNQPQPVLHRLTGHKGVIFSIYYHPGLQRICSVSDDRSIIMYQISFPASSIAAGSGGDDVKVMDWSQATFELMLSVFGHSGRVWDVVLLSDVFVSVGEDAHCIVWNYSGDIVHKHRGHKGRSIWSMAASQDETFVVTGGGDGSIRQWRLQGKGDQPITQVHLKVPDSVKECSDDFIRTLALWDSDNVLLVTNAGSVLHYMVHQDTWQALVHDSDFSSYSTLARSTDGTYIAIGSISGLVRVLHKGQGGAAIHEIKCSLHSGKICGLTWVDQDHFLTTGLQGHCVLAAVQHAPGGSLAVFPVAQLVLPPCKHRWIVSGCLLSDPTSAAPETKPEYLVCGDRNGNVHCYSLPHSSAKGQESLLPAQTFPKFHGNAGVTCVCYHDNTVFTAGRDGQYRRWAINNSQLQLLNSSRVFKGFDWIDQLWVGENGLQILGFYSSKFVIWDQRRGERLLEVECGGGHRSWDCQSLGQGYRFLFIKAKEVVMVTAGQNSNQIIVKPPLHGMKVWDMKYICSHSDSEGAVHHVMCAGSEDTTLSLGTLHSPHDGSLQWAGQHTLHAHLSSIRTLAAVPSFVSAPGHKEAPSDSPRCSPSTGCQSHQGGDHLVDVATRSTAAGRENPQGVKPASAMIVFSAGGRAQIQAWRVTVTEQTNYSQDASSTCMTNAWHHQDESKQKLYPDTTEAKLSAQPDSIASLPQHTGHTSDISFTEHSSASATHTNSSKGSGEMSASSRAERNSLRIAYEHLGGCFLGESRHKRQHKPWKTRYLKLDPETRIMSLVAVAADKLDSGLPACWHLLAAAGSDGILRLFLYDESSHHFTLLCQSSHHRGCILKVFFHLHPIQTATLTHPNPSGSHPNSHPHHHQSTCHPFLLSAATDGQIAVWDLQLVVQCLLGHAQLIHHSGDSFRDPSSLASSRTNIHFASVAPHESIRPSSAKTSHSGDECSASQTVSTDWEKSVVSAPDQGEGQAAGGDRAGSGNTTEDSCDLVSPDGQPAVTEESSDEDGSDEDNDCGRSVPLNSAPSRPSRAQYLGDRPALSLQHILAKDGATVLGSPGGGGSGGVQQDGEWCWSPNQEIKAHQSGVNSLHVKSLADGSLLLVSGGDDNALTVHQMSLITAREVQSAASGDNGSQRQDRRLFDVVSVATKLDAHATQITGVWLLSQYLVTASIDQRVNLWSLSQDFQLKLESSRFVDIADLSNIEVWQYRSCIYIGVCGEGVCLLALQDNRSEDRES